MDFEVTVEILDDTKHVMESWGKAGSLDPFFTIYNVGTPSMRISTLAYLLS
jgi:hypothetical protein